MFQNRAISEQVQMWENMGEHKHSGWGYNGRLVGQQLVRQTHGHREKKTIIEINLSKILGYWLEDGWGKSN
jgi:hypothetical protein